MGGEVPGAQTVPRAEAWAATALLSKVHANAVARLGIDASYVVDGVSKRQRLEKGKNGDIWLLFFALLQYRTADLGVAKVTSHLEEVGTQAVMEQYAFLCDIIENALADEAATIAAELLKPSKEKCLKAEALEEETFLICIRLGFTQARVWELTHDCLLYEAPPETEEPALYISSHLKQLSSEFVDRGHLLELAYRGEHAGHTCMRCRKWKKKIKLNDWLTGDLCIAKPSAKHRKNNYLYDKSDLE